MSDSNAQVIIQITCPRCGKVLGEMEGDEEAGQLKWTMNCEHYAWTYTYNKNEADERKKDALIVVDGRDFYGRAIYFICLPKNEQ